MKHDQLRFVHEFRMLSKNRRSQAVEMVIPPGKTEGGPDDNHRGSDQWLYVVSGTGTAKVAGKRLRLRSRTLLLIERGDPHELKNTGRSPLRTINIYVPPAYNGQGDPLPRGRPE